MSSRLRSTSVKLESLIRRASRSATSKATSKSATALRYSGELLPREPRLRGCRAQAVGDPLRAQEGGREGLAPVAHRREGDDLRDIQLVVEPAAGHLVVRCEQALELGWGGSRGGVFHGVASAMKDAAAVGAEAAAGLIATGPVTPRAAACADLSSAFALSTSSRRRCRRRAPRSQALPTLAITPMTGKMSHQ